MINTYVFSEEILLTVSAYIYWGSQAEETGQCSKVFLGSFFEYYSKVFQGSLITLGKKKC